MIEISSNFKGLLLLWTLICLLVLLSYSIGTTDERKKLRTISATIDRNAFNESRRGMRNSGIFVIFSNIPFIGFIFMFMLASSSARIAEGLRRMGIKTGKAPNRFSSIALISGLGMLLGLFIINFNFGGSLITIKPHYALPATTIVYYTEILWVPVFLTLEVGTLLSFSSRGTGIVTSIFGVLFLLIFIGISFNYLGSISHLLYYSIITEILIGLMFIINYYTTGSMQKRGSMNVNNYGSKSGNSGMSIQDSENRGYKPQFQKTVKDGNVENTVPQRNVTSPFSQDQYILTREEQRNTIAIIGPPGAGKTTFLAYFFHFLDNIESTLNVEADVTSGIELMDEYINRIFSESKFPQLTAKDRVGEVIFRFTRKRRLSERSVILRINDIAGETFNSLQGGRDQIRRLIYGTRFEYLLRSRAYIVMIDCSTFKDWSSKDLQYRRMIEAILEARLEKKIHPRLLFLFTKTDTLPEEAFSMSPLDLLKLLKNTHTFATKNVKDVSAFKIYIKTERTPSGEIVPKLDFGIGGMKQIQFDPQMNSGFMFTANWICEIGGI